MTSILWSYLTQRTFKPELEKKIKPPKSSLYFRKWNFLVLIFKNFKERKPRKKFLKSREIESRVHSGKIYFTSRNRSPAKISYIFSKESFSYISENKNSEKIPYIFRKRNFLIFQERYSQP